MYHNIYIYMYIYCSLRSTDRYIRESAYPTPLAHSDCVDRNVRLVDRNVRLVDPNVRLVDRQVFLSRFVLFQIIAFQNCPFQIFPVQSCPFSDFPFSRIV